MEVVYIRENFTENYLFHATTALKFEADISIRYLLLITMCWGQFQKICYRCLQKPVTLILTRNKLFSSVPASICLVAVTHPYPVALEKWPS